MRPAVGSPLRDAAEKLGAIATPDRMAARTGAFIRHPMAVHVGEQIAAHVKEGKRTGDPWYLMLEAPPRHGKSMLVSHKTPPWFLQDWPGGHVGIVTYEANFSASWGRKVRDDIEEYGGDYGLAVRRDSRSISDFHLTNGSNVFCTGVGGPLTGRGFHLLVIDDPIKNAEEAASPTIREKHWDWWQSTASTRIEPGGGVVLMMCMTGDTSVLMADSTERPLRDIRPGDQVATYDAGRLGTSTVRNHKSNGPDFIHEIKTTCGTTVRANARHPFLVRENGQVRWTRLRDLRPGQKIVTARGGGGSGAVWCAASTSATSRSARGGTARSTMAGSTGQMAIALPRQDPEPNGTLNSSTYTESPWLSTMPCSCLRVGCARCAISPQAITYQRSGGGSSPSTTATTPTSSGGCCATTVTLPSGTPRQRPQPEQSWSTSDFTTAQIESITPAGVEEVFDVQIDRTENFIANGLVSHNTRWNEDDLAGRLLKAAKEDPKAPQWHRFRYPAICESDDDPLGRSPGEALWPDRYDIEQLDQTRRRSGVYYWAAMYQQRPAPLEGGLFERRWFIPVEAPCQPHLPRVRAWDLAGGSRRGADWSAGVLWARSPTSPHHVRLEDINRFQGRPRDVEEEVLATAQSDGPSVVIQIQQDPGQAGLAQVEALQRLLRGYRVEVYRPTGDKETRAIPLSAKAMGGFVEYVRGDWNDNFFAEGAMFPNGANDDQIDAASAGLQLIETMAPRSFFYLPEDTYAPIRRQTATLLGDMTPRSGRSRGDYRKVFRDW